MAFLDEIAAYLQSEGVGTVGTTIFLSSSAMIPQDRTATPFLVIRKTGGTSANRTHNSVTSPATVRPGAQIVAKAASYKLAENLAQAAYNALTKVRNQLLTSTWYQEVSPLQEVFDMGLDDKNRAQATFNIIVTKRPS